MLRMRTNAENSGGLFKSLYFLLSRESLVLYILLGRAHLGLPLRRLRFHANLLLSPACSAKEEPDGPRIRIASQREQQRASSNSKEAAAASPLEVRRP